MDIPEIPNVSKSAAAYLLQAAVELASEAAFEPTSEAQMREWIDRNSQLIYGLTLDDAVDVLIFDV